MTEWRWRGVLAGAYKGPQLERRIVAHLVNVETREVLCRRVDPDRMSDADDYNSPKCPRCVERGRKWARG